MIIRGTTLISRLAVLFAALFLFTACGGGGGGGGDFYKPADEEPTLHFALYDAQGNITDTVTPAALGTLKVTVTERGGNIEIKGSVPEDAIGVSVLPNGTALTNANGVATFQIQIAPGTGKGAVTFSAAAVVDGRPLTGEFGIQVGERDDLKLGYYDIDGDFIENAISIQPDTTLASDARAQMSLVILDENFERVNTTQYVTFSSACLSSGLAALDPPVNPVQSVNGQVDSIFSLLGCSGQDEITASIVGSSAMALGNISIAPAEASGLLFVSALPQSIAVSGSGGSSQLTETSTVIFKVVDTNGSPIQGVPVEFVLTQPSRGGVTLSPASALTTSSGTATTTVTSGDVTEVVNVTATATTPLGQQVANISDDIFVTSGLPVQNAISLTVSDGGYVVENGMTQNDITRTVTVQMLDSFNNPVPNGTQADFRTEYGSIDSSCRTGLQNGAGATLPAPSPGKCSVLWSSNNPRTPAGTTNQAAVQTITNNPSYDCNEHNGTSGPCPGDLGYTRGGRSTISVTALGQETFLDSNGSGVMEPSEKDDFENLPEAFLDKNEDGAYTPTLCAMTNAPADQCLAGSEESYVDLNNNGQYDLNNNPAVYNGLACPPEGDGVYCSRTLVNVRTDVVLTLSAPDLGGDLWNIIIALNGGLVVGEVSAGSNYKAYISDLYNNRPPAGSTVTVSGAGGCEILSETSFDIANSSSVGSSSIDVVTGGTGAVGEVDPQGTLTISLDPVGGTPVSESFICKLNNPCDVVPPAQPPSGCT
jgi:hypothetical protein